MSSLGGSIGEELCPNSSSSLAEFISCGHMAEGFKLCSAVGWGRLQVLQATLRRLHVALSMGRSHRGTLLLQGQQSVSPLPTKTESYVMKHSHRSDSPSSPLQHPIGEKQGTGPAHMQGEEMTQSCGSSPSPSAMAATMSVIRLLKLCKIREISSKPFPQRRDYIILLGYQVSIPLCSCRLCSAELRGPENAGV